MEKQKPKDGDLLDGCFWLNGEPWLIFDRSKPLNQFLVETLQEQREYIERLTKRADTLAKWLGEQK